MLPILLALLVQSEDWPGFLGPRRDGTSREQGLISPWPEKGPRLVWQRELGSGFGSASVAGGRVLVFDRSGDKARVSCLKAADGSELWRFEYVTDYVDRHGDNNGPRCCPVIDDGRVYAYGVEGMLHALRLEDGTLLWKKDTAADFGVVPNFFGVGSTPLVEGDLLLTVVGGSPPNSPDIASGETQPAGSAVVAFDKRTGEVRYKTGDDLAAYGSPVAATIAGRRWCFVFARGGLLAFEPAGGKVDFHFPWRAKSVQTVNAISPVVVGDLVFISDAYSIGGACMRIKTGGYDVVWQDGRKRERSMSSWWHTPIVIDGHLYGASGMEDSDLRCVDLATGAVKWTDKTLKHTSLLRVDGRFVGLTDDGVLWLLELTPQGCRKISEAMLMDPDGRPFVRPPARAAPALSNGRLYVRGKDRLVCLQVAQAEAPPLSPEERAALEKDLDLQIARCTEALVADPKQIETYSRRGDARFFRGRFAEALADYEKMVELDPSQNAQHWRRGIARFYAGDYPKAAAQFEIYHSFDNVDRENGIWRYLSQVKAHGRDKAREGLLKYAKDDREPFPAVYQLFAGKTTPDEILKGIAVADISNEERQSRNFYARLYIGLNAAVEGHAEQARINLREAVANPWPRLAGFGPRWMWHVGRVHFDLLQAK